MGYNAFIHTKDAVSGAPREIKGDESGSLIQISQSHTKVHQGLHYDVSKAFLAVASAGTAELLIKVPAALEIHIAYGVMSTAEGRFQLYEGPTITGDGTAVAVIQDNRSSSNTSTVTAFHTPTTSADGTLIKEVVIPGGSGGTRSGSDLHRKEDAFIFAASTNYLVRFTNDAVGTANVSLEISFYEDAA